MDKLDLFQMWEVVDCKTGYFEIVDKSGNVIVTVMDVQLAAHVVEAHNLWVELEDFDSTPSHETMPVEIDGEICEIDTLMVPTIKWLNSFPTVHTLFCCEGDEDENKFNEDYNWPYVLFTCESSEDLAEIMDKMPELTECEVNYYNGQVRYYIRFVSKSIFRLWSEKMFGERAEPFGD